MPLQFPKSEQEWLELRHLYVSSTESSALFGLSPYQTPFELAVEKKSPKPNGIGTNNRMTWGKRLQEAIAKGVSEDYGVKVRRVTGYAVNPNCNMGASFDYEIVGLKDEWDDDNDPMLRQMYKDLGPGVLEIKNVDWLVFKNDWKLEDGQIEAPPHIEIQVQHQLHCIERKWGVMGVLVGGNDAQLILRERDQEVGKAIETKVGEFWALIGRGEMPPVKLPEDVDIIRKIYLLAEPGKLLELHEDAELERWCQDYREVMQLRDANEASRKTIGARILQKIGNAEKVLCKGYSIQANTVGEALIEAYTRKSYRNLTVRVKKANAS
jgi:predicted phage-related endonuclease